MSAATMQRELEQLRAENAKLKEDATAKIKLKIGAKGGVSLYGLGRFPVTLYAEQWETVLGMSAQIQDFIQKNRSQLKLKNAE